MPQFYIPPSEYAQIMSRYEYIMDTLIAAGEVKQKKSKAASETFRYMVNGTYFKMKSEEIENKVNNSKKEAG